MIVKGEKMETKENLATRIRNLCYNVAMHKLLEQAKEAAKNAYCKYSDFPVGAAVMTENGAVYTGCNVENASYGLTICAERNAVAAAVANGETKIRAVAIYSPKMEKITPCGACLQVLAEFGTQEVITEAKDFKMHELLPEAFCI